MATKKLADHIYSVGVLNPGLRVFDIIMDSPYGSSYNAYLVTGQKNVLIETVHADFFEEYLDNIQSIIDISEIDYLIMNHTEPDHSGSVAKLIALNPNIEIYSTMAAKKYITAIANQEFRFHVVKSGETLDLGDRSLQFIVAPLLHWPDSMFTWDEKSGLLFTCDFLGTHFCEPTMVDTNMHYREKYLEQVRHYYECIFGPFKPYVLSGLDKIKDLPVRMVCTSHGPCLVQGIQEITELYRKWSQPAERDLRKIAILYASAYGCTKQLAEAAYEELAADSELDVKLIDVVFTPFEETVTAANDADALLVGSCTINRDAPKIIWDVLSSIDAINVRSRPAGAFGSFGWSGEAVGMVRSRMEHLKYNFLGEGIRSNFTPTADDLAKMKCYARSIADQISE
ncbi:FprA family A-type flavoprotein [Clostridium merdae]|uniref:FprA family A-type flavoprotein n=1 Tax=Clostridium merdae TaxID=1958780 RepID=UPI000A269B3F|nr:FprA family A-type flavoprotein [Clostridium merdae]